MLVKNKGKFIHNVGGVQLVPGSNQLTKKQSEAFNAAIKSNELNAFLVEKGTLSAVEGKGGKDVQSVTDMTLDQALPEIVDTVSVETLTKWLADEQRGAGRKKMVDTLKARIAELKTPEDE